MKIQRSHFRLISLFLVCAFLAVMLLCSVHVGLVTPPVPEAEEGNQAVTEESLNKPEDIPEDQENNPDNRETVSPDESEYVTTGL